MVANRRAFVAGLAVLAVLAMGFAVDGPRSPARRLSKTEVALTGIEPGGFGRAALKPVEDQGARPIRSLRLLLASFGILAGLALFLGRRHRSGQGGVHVPHGIDWGPASVRGPPFLLA